MSNLNAVRVVVRFRPLNERERGEVAPFAIDSLRHSVQLSDSEDNANNSVFAFDAVHDSLATQSALYDSAARATIDDVLKGYNGTIFAYGQTGAGKTFTMFGADSAEMRGIVPRACAQLFEHIEQDLAGTEYTIKCSFLEIYREVVRDLLSPTATALRVRESPERGVWVDGLSQVFCTSADDIMQLLRLGEKSRATSATNMNAVSSRSHSLFVLELTQKLTDGSTRTGRLNLADLAGSEKVAKTGASGETLEEAKKINQSLSALGNCIAALTEGRSHIPYRDSKLTFVLRESLGGNCKTTLLVAASPARSNVDETISALRFGARAKLIKNAVTVNVRRSAAQLEELLTFEEWFSRRLAAELDGSDAIDAFAERRRQARADFERTGGVVPGGATPQLLSTTSSPSSATANATTHAVAPTAQSEALEAAQFQIQQLESELSELKSEQRAAPPSNAGELEQLRSELQLHQTRADELQKQLSFAERKLLAADDACEAMSLELATQRLTAQSEIRKAQVAETRAQQAVADADRATAATAALESRIVDDQMRIEELMSMVLDLEKDLAATKEARTSAENASTQASTLVLRLQQTIDEHAAQGGASQPADGQLQATLVELDTTRTEASSLRKQIEILQRLLEERAAAQVSLPPAPVEAERASTMAQIKQLTRTVMTLESRAKQLESALQNEQQMRAVEQAQLAELESQCMALQTASKDKDQVARQLASELSSTKRDLADAQLRADSFLVRLERQTDRLMEVERLLQQQQQQQSTPSSLTNSRIVVPVGARRVWGEDASLRRSEPDRSETPPPPVPASPMSPSRPSQKAVRSAAARGAELLVPHEADLSHPERAGFLKLRQPGLLWTKNWRDCYCVLAGKRLCWFFEKTSGEPSGSRALSGMSLVRDAEQLCGMAHSFALFDDDREEELMFAATSDAERGEWVAQIVSRVTKSP